MRGDRVIGAGDGDPLATFAALAPMTMPERTGDEAFIAAMRTTVATTA